MCHCDETRFDWLAEARRYNTNVEGSADGHEPIDIAAMLTDSDLSAENRRYVHNALACSMLEGWRPTRESVARLIDAVAGYITADEYRARVVAFAATRGRQFGQLPTISWLTRGNRRLRYRGTIKNDHRLRHRAAALNLRRLINLGLAHNGTNWVIA
jgi:hypothetical protein